MLGGPVHLFLYTVTAESLDGGGGIVCGDGRLFGIVGQANAGVIPQGEELAQCQKRF